MRFPVLRRVMTNSMTIEIQTKVKTAGSYQISGHASMGVEIGTSPCWQLSIAGTRVLILLPKTHHSTRSLLWCPYRLASVPSCNGTAWPTAMWLRRWHDT